MKETTLKSALVAVALSLGGLTTATASAECVLCTLSQNGDEAGIQYILDKRPETGYDGIDAQSVDINGQTAGRGNTALILAARYNRANVVNIVDLLINDPYDPANVNLSNNSGRTPLMWAAQNGNATIVEMLLTKNPTIDATGGGQNKTALQFALDNGHSAVAGILAQAGATLDCGFGEQFNASAVSCEPTMEKCHEDGMIFVPSEGTISATCGECPDNHPMNPETNGCEVPEPTMDDCHDQGMVKIGVSCEVCPNETTPLGNDCVPIPPCGENMQRAEDGIACICLDGHIPDNLGGCVACGTNQKVADNGFMCECKAEFVKYDGENCVAECGINEQWNGEMCVCKANYDREADGTTCQPIPDCNSETEIRNGNSCVCAEGYTTSTQFAGCTQIVNPSDCTDNEWHYPSANDCYPCPTGATSKLPNRSNCTYLTSQECHQQGKILRNYECVSCDDGMELHPHPLYNICIPTLENCHSQNKIREQYYYDGIERCVSCENGQHRHGNECHSNHSCPSGQQLDGHDSCVTPPLTVADCNAENKVLRNGECVNCPSGQHRQGNECVTPPPPPSSCPSGYHRDGSKCCKQVGGGDGGYYTCFTPVSSCESHETLRNSQCCVWIPHQGGDGGHNAHWSCRDGSPTNNDPGRRGDGPDRGFQ